MKHFSSFILGVILLCIDVAQAQQHISFGINTSFLQKEALGQTQMKSDASSVLSNSASLEYSNHLGVGLNLRFGIFTNQYWNLGAIAGYNWNQFNQVYNELSFDPNSIYSPYYTSTPVSLNTLNSLLGFFLQHKISMKDHKGMYMIEWVNAYENEFILGDIFYKNMSYSSKVPSYRANGEMSFYVGNLNVSFFREIVPGIYWGFGINRIASFHANLTFHELKLGNLVQLEFSLMSNFEKP